MSTASSIANQVLAYTVADMLGSAMRRGLRGSNTTIIIVENRIPRALVSYLEALGAYPNSGPLSAIQALCRNDVSGLMSILQRLLPEELLLWRRTTLLHIAAACRPNMIPALVQAGFYVNARNENGSTPLHIACEESCDEACRLLVQLGADVDAQDIFGNTPMMRGVLAGNESAMEVMRQLGANPHIMNFSALTPKEAYQERSQSLFRALCSSLVFGALLLPRKLLGRTRIGHGKEEQTRGISLHDASDHNASRMGVDDVPLMPVAVPLETQGGGRAMGGAAGVVQARDVVMEAETVTLRTPPALRAQGAWPPGLGSCFLVLFIAWIVFACLARTGALGPDSEVSDGAFFGVGFVLYIIQLIEAIVFGRKYLTKCISSDRAFVDSCSQLGQPTRLTFVIACYHMEMRFETYTDKDGKTHTRSRQERVYTHRATREVGFDEFWILQDAFLPFSGVCLIDYESSYEFADGETSMLVEQEKTRFIAENNRDDHFDFSVQDGYVPPSGCVALDGLASVRLINFPAYACLSFLLLSVPYRTWLNSVSSKQTMHIKRFLWKA